MARRASGSANVTIRTTADTEAATKALDSVGAAFGGVRRGLAATAKGAEGFGRATSSAFKLFRDGVTTINQGLEILRKVGKLFEATVVDSVKAALEFRDKNDETRRAIEGVGESANVLRVRLGENLLPVLEGIARTLTPIIDQLAMLVSRNRELIATRIVEFFRSAATTITDAFADALIIATKGVNGLRFAYLALKVAVSEVTAAQLSAVEFLIRGLGQAASVVNDDLGGAMIGAADTVRGLADEFARSSDAAQTEMDEAARGVRQLERSVERVRSAVKQGIADAAANGRVAVENFAEGSGAAIDKATDKASRLSKELGRPKALKIKPIDSELERAARAADAFQRRLSAAFDAGAQEGLRFAEANDQVAQDMEDAFDAASQNIAASIGRAFGEAVSGTKDFTAAIKDLLRALLSQGLQLLGTIVGFILGGPIGAIAGSFVGGLGGGLSEGLFAQHGGVVRGGVSGRDSVPVFAQQGETFLDTELTDRLEQFLAGTQSTERGPLHLHFSHTVPESRVDIEKRVRDEIEPALAMRRLFG